MTKAQQKLESQASKLRDSLAKAEATVDELKAKLRKVEGKIAGDPTPDTGLDILWNEAPPIARTRSSKFKCRAAWNRIPANQRPRVVDVIAALKTWKRCYEWKKDDGQFVPALDRWIRERRWESLPEDVSHDPMARYRSTPKTLPTPSDAVTPQEVAEILGSIKPKRVHS